MIQGVGQRGGLRRRGRGAVLAWGGLGLVAAAIALAAPGVAFAEPIVREIVVEGTQRIEPETVRSYLLIKEGDAFDSGRIDRSLKSLFATGMFADVTLRPQGDRLVVAVVENPVINRIAFEGNKRIEDEELEAEVTLRPRVIYSRSKVQADVKRILTLYRRSGRFAATVEPKVIQLPQNRVDLVFEISEGRATEIAAIRFVGNREFDDSRLREVVRTRESAWWRFFSSDDVYDPDRMTLDRELLRRFYMSNGFAEFRVQSAVAELTPDRENFFLTFTMEEGDRYTFGKVDVEANLRDLNVEDVADVVEIEPEDWYDAEAVEQTVEDLTNAAGELGFAFVDVRPRIDRDREKKVINVAFEVNEGQRLFVERIDIAGNVRTEDKVIRREFRLVEGDAFNAARMRRSKQRIQDLDFFEKVDVERLPGSAPDKTVIKVGVKEKSTGSLSIGAGFSTTNGAMADLSVTERNLLGKGQILKIGTVIAQRKSQVDLSFTEPYFLDREVWAGVDLFHVNIDQQDTSSHDMSATGGALRAGYPITRHLSQSWKYGLKQSKIENVSSAASTYIRAEQGTSILSEVSHSLAYDTRDSALTPTKGYYAKLTNDVAGLGGDYRHMRNKIEGTKYFPIKDEWTVSLSGSAGHIFGIGKDAALSNRFYVGGDEIRGFASAGISPRDKNTDDALGGEWMYTASTELRFPLGLPNDYGISGRTFADFAGTGGISPSAADIDDTGALRASVGVGISWISPFGPIGVDFAVPYLKENYDDVERFRVNFGTRF